MTPTAASKTDHRFTVRGCPLCGSRDGRLLEQTDVEEVLVQPAAAGDAGTALGAALYVQHAVLGAPRDFVIEHAYWGPSYTEADIRGALDARHPEFRRPRRRPWRVPRRDVIKVYPIKPSKRPLIPPGTHVDGTGRLQTVSERTNRRYWRLIRAFERCTGVPMVLNTSFNENEPIVNTPAEALDCFLRTRMDRLVMDNVVVSRLDRGRSPQPPRPTTR